MGRIDHNFNSAEPPVRDRLLEQAPGGSLQLGAGRRRTPPTAARSTASLVTQGFDYRSNTGVTGGYTSALSSRLLLDVRASWSRFGEWRDPAQDFDPATLGFSPTALQLMSGYHYLPLFTFGSFSTTNANSTIASLGSQRSDWGNGFNRPMDTFSVAPTLTQDLGRAHRRAPATTAACSSGTSCSDGFPGGRYQFNGAYTRANNSAALNDRAQSWAQFLLGLPTAATGAVATPGTASSQFEIASPGEFRQMYHGLFVQDDWRVNATADAQPRAAPRDQPGHVRGARIATSAASTSTTSNPIEAAAQAAYAAQPDSRDPGRATSRCNGGLLFADGPVNETVTKLLPRGAFSYLLNERTDAARRLRAVLVRLLLREHQPGRLLAGDAGAS